MLISRRLFSLCALFLLYSTAHAKDSDYHLIITSDKHTKEEYRDAIKQGKIHDLKDQMEAAREGMLSLSQQGIFFKNLKLTQKVENWDQLSRDMFVLRLRNLPKKQLKSLYPKLSAKTLNCGTKILKSYFSKPKKKRTSMLLSKKCSS